MSSHLIPDPEEQLTQVKMVCEGCGLARDVFVPEYIVRENDLHMWNYLCCRCYGLGQMQALLWRERVV